MLGFDAVFAATIPPIIVDSVSIIASLFSILGVSYFLYDRKQSRKNKDEKDGPFDASDQSNLKKDDPSDDDDDPDDGGSGPDDLYPGPNGGNAEASGSNSDQGSQDTADASSKASGDFSDPAIEAGAVAGPISDLLFGGIGDNLLNADGDDTMFGGAGEDRLTGGMGRNTLDGTCGGDLLFGPNEVDALRGGDGNDVSVGGTGEDWLTGATGQDGLDGVHDTNMLVGRNGADTFVFLPIGAVILEVEDYDAHDQRIGESTNIAPITSDVTETDLECHEDPSDNFVQGIRIEPELLG